MNVLFSSDDNYARHLGVALYSLLETNTWCPDIRIFIIDNSITIENKKKLSSLVGQFENSQILWIPFSQWSSRLDLNMEWPISLSSYARLFVASMVPTDVNRIIYLDCDVLVRQSLRELWNTDLDGIAIAAVQDNVSYATKSSIGLTNNMQYFNAGILLLNMKVWREMNAEKHLLGFIAKYNGRVGHHDQGTLNGVFAGKWKRLPLKYNVMTLFYLLPYNRALKMYNEASEFYSESEVKAATTDPAIIHFTPSLTSRPWVKSCVHPHKKLYHDILEKTPWKGYPMESDKSRWYVLLINWITRNVGFIS